MQGKARQADWRTMSVQLAHKHSTHYLSLSQRDHNISSVQTEYNGIPLFARADNGRTHEGRVSFSAPHRNFQGLYLLCVLFVCTCTLSARTCALPVPRLSGASPLLVNECTPHPPTSIYICMYMYVSVCPRAPAPARLCLPAGAGPLVYVCMYIRMPVRDDACIPPARLGFCGVLCL